MTLTRLIRSLLALMFCLLISATAFGIPSTYALGTPGSLASACISGTHVPQNYVIPDKVGKTKDYLVPGDAPLNITSGPGGNLWFTESNDGNIGGKIGRITPNGKITEFPLNYPQNEPPGFIAVGPDGNLWFTQSVTCGGQYDGIVRMTTKGKMTWFPSPHSQPIGITSGPKHDMWFAEYGDFEGYIGYITTR